MVSEKNILHNIVAFCGCLYMIFVILPNFLLVADVIANVCCCVRCCDTILPLLSFFVTDVCHSGDGLILWLMLCHCGAWNHTGYGRCCCHS